MEPGTKVYAPYRENGETTEPRHTGVVLPENSVEAWTGTMAFNYGTPTQAQVDAHLANLERLANKYGHEFEPTVWVRWSFDKIYSEKLDNLKPIA